ncbi:RebB family R body protein [Qipengyuania sp. DY56-A-20]|jgi:hypothetical protein|uniref:RebB family R body protein n=1 Tax=Qipengyuania benthica TaxID=3067651 RepID=A0ABT9H4T9_9SPHN|nr:RebB family R body protein [Qipengyuania sp. DY56-A-20]MBU1253824.1 RebB family R body protein [Alphaproteobacteria bacterium]MBU1607362.1 RebB family R body protein [Alphaproteobacteria bacterium]MDP4538334.1 RebB family R body protein [Qipengyuania sp. DY56-A-20]
MAALSGIAPVAALTIGEAPSAAMAMTYLAMTNSIGHAMENAVAAQHRGQLMAEAATFKVLAMVLKNGA